MDKPLHAIVPGVLPVASEDAAYAVHDVVDEVTYILYRLVEGGCRLRGLHAVLQHLALKQLFDGDAEKPRQRHQGLHIGQGGPGLPLGNRLMRHTQCRGQLLLGHVLVLPQSGNRLSHLNVVNHLFRLHSSRIVFLSLAFACLHHSTFNLRSQATSG